MRTVKLLAIVLLFAGHTLSARAQKNFDNSLGQKQKEAVIDSISRLLNENYIFPEKAKEMTTFLRQKYVDKKYDNISDPLQFSAQLTSDLQSISHDLHINVRFDPQMMNEIRMSHTSEDSLHFVDLMNQREARENFGFAEVKILSDGVGYLKLTGFSGSDLAGEAATAAMNFLSRSEALIIDLRQNGGGSPDMIQLLTSYLFPQGSRIHLNDFYYRPTDDTQQRWTFPYVSGKRMPEAEVYVLTSSRTFSAAEEFTYNLKNLKRATIIGETTGGGAHPGDFMIAGEGFGIFVPSGRAINPITKTNWEGTGVTPNVVTSAEKALDEAHFLAVSRLAERYAQDPENPYNWTRDQLAAVAHPYQTDQATLTEYTGDFGARKITLSDGKLFYQRDGGPQYELKPMAKDLFMILEVPYFRLQFIRDAENIVAVEGIYDNGRRDKNMKITSP